MSLLSKLITGLEMLALPRFSTRPKRCRIKTPRTFVRPERIALGHDVFIGRGSVLSVQRQFRSPMGTQQFDGEILIGNRVHATERLQLYAFQRIEIGDDVLLAANVHMADAFHGYQTAEVPYRDQPFEPPSPITVERGCWIGQNAVILPGVTVGEYSIVGANSVVSRSIPPRSIAVGSPARVIKRWDAATKRWLHVSPSA